MSTPENASRTANIEAEPSRLVDLLEALEHVGSERDFAVDGAIEGSAIVVLSGPEKRGKSWINVDLAVAIASGTKWLGTFKVPEPGTAVVVDGEYGPVEWARRAKRVCEGKGLDPLRVFPRIRYFDGQYGFLLSKKNPAMIELVQHIQKHGADVIIVDPLRNFLDGDENSATDVLEAMRMLHVLRQVGRCPVVAAHHLNKSGGVSGSRAIRTRADLLIDGTDEERPWYSASGRTLRAGDPISRRFTVRIEHENDEDDASARTRLVARFEGESTSRQELSTSAFKLLSALKERCAPASANELGKASGIKNGQVRSRAMRELAEAGLAVQNDGKWELSTPERFRDLAKEAGQ